MSGESSNLNAPKKLRMFGRKKICEQYVNPGEDRRILGGEYIDTFDLNKRIDSCDEMDVSTHVSGKLRSDNLQHWGSGYGQKWEYSKQLYYQLKEVEISGFRDTCNSLGLAIYLLNNAVGLERMKINTRRIMYHVAGNWKYAKSRVTESEKNLVRDVLMKENVKGNVKLIVL